MNTYSFHGGVVQLPDESIAGEELPGPGPRIVWRNMGGVGMGFPNLGYFNVGDICINLADGTVSVCTVASGAGGDTWEVVGTQT